MENPKLIGLAGTSSIKLAAAKYVLREYPGFDVAVIPDAKSCVNEQPFGLPETIRGACSRALTAWQSEPGCFLYLGIENGIVYIQNGFQDVAIAAILDPSNGLIRWEVSDVCPFPADAVLVTEKLPGGFRTNTVGKTLQGWGRVSDHADPHKDLGDKFSRQHYIEQCLRCLFLKALN